MRRATDSNASVCSALDTDIRVRFRWDISTSFLRLHSASRRAVHPASAERPTALGVLANRLRFGVVVDRSGDCRRLIAIRVRVGALVHLLGQLEDLARQTKELVVLG